MRKARVFKKRERGPRRNDEIRASEVLLIDENGKKVGVMPTLEAIRMAHERDLDLVEVAAHLVPPLAKIVDFGKFKYDQKKHAKNKKQKILEIKEIRFSVGIDEHDLQTKLKHAIEFLAKGHKVKLNVFFRGRQMAHKELGYKLLKDFVAKLSDFATLEQDLTHQGRVTFAVVAPKKR
jgi:translation initiation factor IF-3